MQLSINKAKTLTVITVVLLMTSLTLVAMQIKPAEAFPPLAPIQPYVGALHPGDIPNATLWDGTSFAALSFVPNPIGVGQMLLVNFWINPSGTNQWVWIPQDGYVITITKPDGTQDVIKTHSEPATFAYFFQYYPDQVGTWTLKFDFMGAYFPAGIYYDGKIYTNTSSDMVGNTYQGTGAVFTPVNSYYKPSSTGNQTLIVLANPVYSWPLAMPTDYWTRPASINNRGWWPLLGAWPATGFNGYVNPNWDTLYPDTEKQLPTNNYFSPNVPAPNTAHVLWKRLGTLAGLIGGPAGQFGTTSTPPTPDLIYAGRCYDTETVSINGVPTSCAVCYDLRTGEYYYQIPTASPSNGITPNLVAYLPPQASGTGTVASEELGSSTWSVELLSISGSYLRKINPLTGALTGNYSIAPLSGGTFMNQINGYVVNIQDLGASAGANRYRLINWTTRGTGNLTQTVSGVTTTRIVSNTTYQRSSLPSYCDWTYDLGAVTSAPLNYGPMNNSRWLINCVIYKLSTGEVKYNMTTDAYPDILYHGPGVMEHGKVAEWASNGCFIIFDGTTGHWFRSEQTDYPWSSIGGFGAYSIASAYGMVFRFAYNYVYAFNWTDGSIVWKYSAPTYAPFETPYTDVNGTEVYSFNGQGYVVDGKMYIANTEHTPTWPLARGWGIHCINITDGKGLWKLDNPMSVGAFADGYGVFGNGWDGYTYVIGKGQSATTVSGPDVAVSLGTGVLIKGTVLDQSPAQAGTPCVSKDSMNQQMEYLHLSQPIGGIWNNVTVIGVPVSLTAIDENGNPYDLGTTTTNGYSGVFSVAWTPPAEGKYDIIATFAGDDSYGSSMSTTAVSVGPAPAETPPVEIPTPVDYSTMLYGIMAAVVIAIVLALVAILLLFRKH